MSAPMTQPDLLLDEHRERMAIVNAAVAEVSRLSAQIAAAPPRRTVDLADPKIALAIAEVERQERFKRPYLIRVPYVCPACVRDPDGVIRVPTRGTFRSAAALTLHLIACPSYDDYVTPQLGDARPF